MKKILTTFLILILSATMVLPVLASDSGNAAGETTTTASDSGNAAGETTTVASGNGNTAEETTTATGTSDAVTAKTNTPSVNANGQTEIYDYDDLLSIKDNTSGSYILMADIDLKGKTWTPVDFTGNFDGNGHAILNAEITAITQSTRVTKDGNMICYDTYFSGFFGIVELATISNLKLLGINVNVESNVPTFIGGIAGFMEESTISGCTVEGSLTLKTSGANWGIGGFFGFGNGTIQDSTANTTLVGVDTDAANKDEQFMGGAYAVGYASLINNSVAISGYVSEHGYAHNGGLVGMYELYYEGIEYYGTISNNWVSGHITFYEDNDDPRAYCEPYIGEVMTWCFDYDGNGADFTPNNITEEHRESGFTTVLQPHTCSNPTYNDSVVNSTCTDYGYTEHTCSACGYAYKSDYTPLGHNVKEWTTVKEASIAENGLEKGTCDSCGNTVYRAVALEIEVPVEADTTDLSGQADGKETATGTEKTESKGISTVGIIIIIVVVLAIIAAVILTVFNNKKKRRKRGRRPENSGQRRTYDDHERQNNYNRERYDSRSTHETRSGSDSRKDYYNQERRGPGPTRETRSGSDSRKDYYNQERRDSRSAYENRSGRDSRNDYNSQEKRDLRQDNNRNNSTRRPDRYDDRRR